ncbi:hypothetical protein [Paenibacillus filicis]|uniref:hypothetical protein n=1 Tax=Paenibacillus filicis TaxID=669464 RepID=UPI00311A2B35
MPATGSHSITVKAVSIFDVESAASDAVSASVAGKVIAVKDTFDRPSSANLGNVEVGVAGALAWERTNADRYDIYNPEGTNGSLRRTGASGIGQYAVVQTGVDDMVMTIDHTALAANKGPTVVLRFADNQNLISVSFSLKAGFSTRIANQLSSNIIESPNISPNVAAGEKRTYTIGVLGSTVFVLINGSPLMVDYDERLSQVKGRKAGVGSSDPNDLFDNFEVTAR